MRLISSQSNSTVKVNFHFSTHKRFTQMIRCQCPETDEEEEKKDDKFTLIVSINEKIIK